MVRQTRDRFDVIIVGAGQAGLAMGHALQQERLALVILERAAQLGQTWRDRYDSLRLYTPGRYNGLPGLPFLNASDAHFPLKAEVIDYLEQYAATFALPIELSSPVSSIEPGPDGAGYVVRTGEGTLHGAAVIIATGAYIAPSIPVFASELGQGVRQLHSSQYRNPASLQPGPVLVVGGGASGTQIAEELVLAGDRQVFLSLGTRLWQAPRRILGRSWLAWLHTFGLTRAHIESPLGKRLRPIDLLVGADLGRLERDHGLVVLSRTAGATATGGRLATLAMADSRTVKVTNVIWATGYRPDYHFLRVPGVLSADGRPIHRRGVTVAPGLYFLGLQWQWRLTSSLIHGVGADAEFIAAVEGARAKGRGPRFGRGP